MKLTLLCACLSVWGLIHGVTEAAANGNKEVTELLNFLEASDQPVHETKRYKDEETLVNDLEAIKRVADAAEELKLETARALLDKLEMSKRKGKNKGNGKKKRKGKQYQVVKLKGKERKVRRSTTQTAGHRPIVYYTDNVQIARVIMDKQLEIIDCVLFPVNSTASLAPSLPKGQTRFVDGSEFNKIKKTCAYLSESTSTPPDVAVSEKLQRDKRFLELFQGIWPGTLWCGLGNIVSGSNESALGTEAATDACCRAHDLCNPYIASGEDKFGLFNAAIYTKLSCECDAAFHECLKAAGSESSDGVGYTFFSLLAPQCLMEDYPWVCVEWMFGWWPCISWERDTTQAKEMQFFDCPYHW